MRVILITLPEMVEGEAATINEMFAAGLQTLHLRKPGAGADEVVRLINNIGEGYRNRIVLHSHFLLVERYGLLGAHLGAARPLGIEPFSGQTSYSCHTLGEVAAEKERHAYVFLSPIFNSISKRGYKAAFSEDDLVRAARQGLIDSHVVALGGVTPDRCDKVREWGFGGVAILGDVWQNDSPVDRLSEYLRIED